VELDGATPSFIIRRNLENTGEHIVQPHYCHNFTRIDDRPIGSDYCIDVPLVPTLLQSSAPLFRAQLFGTGRTICPEPFVRLDIAPGASMTWTTRYELCSPGDPREFEMEQIILDNAHRR
jgi:hypothetical protein